MKIITHTAYYTLIIFIFLACQPAPEKNSKGSFVDKGGQHTSGTFRIEQDGEQQWIVLSNDFQTNAGPDLHIVLTPISTETADNDNALAEGKALVIAPLESLTGSQRYKIPENTDLSIYQSVVVHCIKFSHLYGAASLN